MNKTFLLTLKVVPEQFGNNVEEIIWECKSYLCHCKEVVITSGFPVTSEVQ